MRAVFRDRPLLFLITAAFFLFSVWFYVDQIWSTQGDVRVPDLYARWYGSRELLLHGRDPYSPAVSREIQVWMYGHPVDGNTADGIRDENRFAYPLYIAFLLAPTVWLPFRQVAQIFRFLLPVLASVTIWLWLRMLRWRCSRPALALLFVLSFANFPVLESLYLQQPALLSALFLAGSGAALTLGFPFLAGVLLAISTIKPQLTGLVSLWLLAWSMFRWSARKRLFWGFAAAMALLLAASEWMAHGWITEFVAGLSAYQRYTGNTSLLSIYLGRLGATLVTLLILAAFGILAWRLRQAAPGSWGFNFVFCAALVATVGVAPTMYPTGQILLLPALYLMEQNHARIWACGAAVRLCYAAAWGLIGWQWLSASALLFAWLLTPLENLRRWWLVPVGPLLILPLTLVVLFAWVARKELATVEVEA